MTTARDWIDRALRANGTLSRGDSLAPEDAQTALDRLNLMLDAWSIEPGIIYALNLDTFVMTPTVAAYSSSLLANGRPADIKSMRVSLSGIDYDVDPEIDETTFNTLPYKAAPGIPDRCWVNTTFPQLIMNFYPTPYAAFTCTVAGWGLLQGVLTLDTVVTVPPGYGKAIVDGLSIDTCSSFGATPSDTLRESAREAKAWIKRRNFKPREMLTGLPPTTARRGRYNIFGDN